MKIKKVLGLVLACVLSLSCLMTSACGVGKISGDNALEVYVCSLGNGDEWLYKALEEFAKKDYVKEKYPNFEYSVTSNDTFAFGQDQVKSSVTTFDLLFASSFSPSTVEIPGKDGKTSILEDITDVYNSKIPDFNNGGYEKNADGEEWTYAEKLEAADPNVFDILGYEVENADGDYETHYYYVGGGGSIYGILYNKTVMLKKGFITEENGVVKGLPRTTKELKAFAVKIAEQAEKDRVANNKNKPEYYPFVVAKDTGYWSRVQNLWWAQYEGAEAYDRYFQGQYRNDEGEWVQGVEVLSKAKGRLLANQATESLLRYDNEPRLIDGESALLDFTTAQARLITGVGLMQANGTWFDNEMKSIKGEEGADNEIRLMPTIMISDIIDHTPSIQNDQELSALVGAMNDGVAALSGTYEGVAYEVTQADFNRIKEAHNLYNTGESLSPILIPSYSDAIGLAKDFLLYMATDEYCRQYMESTGGTSAPHYYDVENKDPALYNSIGAMNRDRLQLIKGKSSILQYKTCNYPIVYRTGYASLGQGYEIKYMAKNEKDRKSAAQCIADQISEYTRNGNEMWNLLLSQAGLK